MGKNLLSLYVFRCTADQERMVSATDLLQAKIASLQAELKKSENMVKLSVYSHVLKYTEALSGHVLLTSLTVISTLYPDL